MSTLYKLQELFPNGKAGKKWFNIDCVFCAEKGLEADTDRHLGINYKYGYVHCWRCRTSHKLSYFLKLNGTDYENLDLTFEEPTLKAGVKAEVDFPKEYINAIDLFDFRYSSYLKALEYIDKRIGIDLALKLNVGFCNTGDYANRIVVPMFNEAGVIEYFVARAVYDFLEPKILNPFGDRKSILFNWDTARNFSEVFIAEGVFSALTVYPFGIATLGKEITEMQIIRVLHSDVKVVNILLDANAISDAYAVANRILSLTSRLKIRVLELRDGQPDNFSFEHILNLKKNTPFYTGNVFI